MSGGDADRLPYRPCAGVVLTNAQGRIFAGQRAGIDTPAWQMPQGGIDSGEDPIEAAYRELEEETGVGRHHVTFLAETAGWLAYDFPDELAIRWKAKFRGQTQKWMHVRLDAPDSVINLNFKDIEFSDWRWMTAEEILTVIVPFKRDIYEAVLKEFAL